jgi:proton-translocating NADH-quinone oxidoreductase chain M
VSVRALRFWALLVGVWIALCAALPATAGASTGQGGHVLLSLPNAAQGPLDLVPGQGSWSGVMRVTNVGAEPLTVSRIAIRGDEDDVRSPLYVTVRFVEGVPTSATLAPGASRDVLLSWFPDRTPRVRQAFGHVIVTSTDEQSGEVAMGFRAELPTGLGWIGEHALSLLVLAPLLVLLIAGVSRLAGRRDDPWVRHVAIGVSVVDLLLALWTYRHFVPDFGRADGNDGFQLVERIAWVRAVGAEWYVGVDGTSVLLVVLAVAVSLVAVLVDGERRRTDAYHCALALLGSAVVLALVALDLVLFYAAWVTVVVCLVVLVAGWGGPRAHRAAARLGVVGGIGSAALLLAFAALSGGSGRSLLVDGTAVAHTMSIPDLARTSFAARGPILGLPFAGATWVLLFVSVACASPLVPFHGWLPDALEEGPAAAGIVLGSAASALGPYLLVRVGLGALPEVARLAGPSMVAAGGIAAVWGALCATVQRDVRRFAAYLVIANAGLCLYGVGSLTAESITGAALALFAHGLAAAMLLTVAHALESRARTCDAMRLQGLARDAPVLAALLAASLAASLGVPGVVGSWAIVLTFVGGFVRHPLLALVLAGSLVGSAAAHARMARLLLFEKVDARWRQNRSLEPFGGRLPDATSFEMLALVPIAALALVLGFWPIPALSPMETAARDASAPLDSP